MTKQAEQIVLTNAAPGDRVYGVELAELDRHLPFLTRPDAEAFFTEIGYGWENPDELVYAAPAEDYTAPDGFPSITITVSAEEAQAVREAIAEAQVERDALRDA